MMVRLKKSRGREARAATRRAEESAPVERLFPDRPHLRNSRPLCWDRETATPAAKAAISALLAELESGERRKRARRAADRDRLEATLEAIALDLFVAAGEDDRLYLAYSRQDADYAPALRRYLHASATATTVVQTARFLETAGYAEGHRGSYRRGAFGGRGYRARLRAEAKLVTHFVAHGVTLADVGLRDDAELIRLKGPAERPGGPKPLLGYEDTARTRQMREGLRRWTQLAAGHDIQAGCEGWDASSSDPLDEGAGAGEVIDRHRARMYRVFNNGRWDAGGRFYGGWWMTMPSEVRKGITIDGEPVVELDFKALHPRVAYHLSGRPLPADDDPYDLGSRWAAVDRGVIKVAFNQLLAVGPEGGIRRPKDTELPRGLTYPALLRALEEKHQVIRPWLRNARALDLQYLDSRIAEKVLDYFTIALVRPVLPVHDSFIVAQRDEYKLGETMFLAYRAVLKGLSRVEALPVVKGWTAGTGVEERVLATMRAVHVGQSGRSGGEW